MLDHVTLYQTLSYLLSCDRALSNYQVFTCGLGRRSRPNHEGEIDDGAG
jgi:hypothetical protein